MLRRVSAVRHNRFAIPLANPRLFRFYVDSLLVPDSRREMVWAAVAHASPVTGRLTLPLLRKSHFLSDSADIAATVPGDLAELTCTAFAEGGVLRRGASAILLDDYDDSDREKAVLFLFDAGASKPSAVAKVSGLAAQRAALRRQQQTLSTLRTRLERLGPTVPRPLGELRIGGTTAFAESYSGQRSMYVDLRNSWRPRAKSHGHFARAFEWLIQFQQVTRQEDRRLDESVIGQFVRGPLQHYARARRPSAAVLAVLEEAEKLAKCATGATLPITACQGDFWAANIVFGGETTSVVDWDAYRATGTPFTDAFHFVMSYGLNYPWQLGRWADPGDAFRATVVDPTWLSHLVRASLGQWAGALGIEAALLPVFFPVYLAEQALAEHLPAASGPVSGGGVAAAATAQSPGKWSALLQCYADAGGSRCFRTRAGGPCRAR
jgi:hypothetical protein